MYAYPKNVIFAIHNGGARNKIEATIMKGESVLAGVADLFVTAGGSMGELGLFIEMKYGNGKMTATQKEFGRAAIGAGYEQDGLQRATMQDIRSRQNQKWFNQMHRILKREFHVRPALTLTAHYD